MRRGLKFKMGGDIGRKVKIITSCHFTMYIITVCLLKSKAMKNDTRHLILNCFCVVDHRGNNRKFRGGRCSIPNAHMRSEIKNLDQVWKERHNLVVYEGGGDIRTHNLVA